MPGDASYPPIRRLSPEERADLVKDLLAGRVFTVKHIPDGEQALAGLIFLPIGRDLRRGATGIPGTGRDDLRASGQGA